jgi:hypothetical protein
MRNRQVYGPARIARSLRKSDISCGERGGPHELDSYLKE